MQLIFLGAPGAGKGTQASTLAQQLNIPHISTGDILRQEIASQTSLGTKAQTYVEAGELVPDVLVMALIGGRFGNPDTKNGWLLDGFPRSLEQARALDQLLVILRQPYPLIINFQVKDEVLIERLLQRGRQDDNQETISRRLEVYREATFPLISYYQKHHRLINIDGNLPVSEVSRLIQKLLNLTVAVENSILF